MITLYTSFVLLFASLIKLAFSGSVELTTYMDVLYPDHLIMLCDAIFIARAKGDFTRYLW